MQVRNTSGWRESASKTSDGQHSESVRQRKTFALRGIDCRPVRREGIADRLYCNWSKEFLKSVEKRPTGDTVPAAITDEVKHLRHNAR